MNCHRQSDLSKQIDKRILNLACFVIAGFLVLILSINENNVYAQNENVTIKTTKLTDSIYMLEGSGGNIAVSVIQKLELHTINVLFSLNNLLTSKQRYLFFINS